MGSVVTVIQVVGSIAAVSTMARHMLLAVAEDPAEELRQMAERDRPVVLRRGGLAGYRLAHVAFALCLLVVLLRSWSVL